MPCQVDAHGFRGDLIVPNGFERPAVGGVNQHHDNGDADSRQQEGHEAAQPQAHLSGVVLDIEAGKGWEALQGIGAVGHRPQLIPLEHGPDNLAEPQCRDSQIIALEPQRGDADDNTEDARHNPRQDNGQHKGGKPRQGDAFMKIPAV